MTEKLSLDERLAQLPTDRLEAMRAAAAEMENCHRVLKKVSSNVVGEILRNQGTFYEWSHYPKGDVTDWETHSQYYYHAHPKSERPGEHGHFHTFVRYAGMPEDAEPAPLTHPQKKNENRIGAHIVAISMDKKGYPIKLFTVNRWVTDETWYPASDMIRMIEQFEIDHTYPSWATNRWLSAMFVLYRPQIEDLLERRDARVAEWANRHPDTDVFEDRKLEITSEMTVKPDAQVAAVDRALAARN